MTRGRATGAALVAVALVVGVVTLGASPASAHGLGGLEPTNYESSLRSVNPHVDGLHLRITDLGTRIELTNDGPRDVVVLGYSGEPYLRVGPDGAFENIRSPATYLNRSATITSSTTTPKSADANAAPVWRQVSSGTTATWHDHRTHLMATDDPPEVRRARDERHVVDNWKVPLRVGNERVVARGQLVYVPPPSPWPWVAGAVGLAALVVVVSRTRVWQALFATTLTILSLAELAHVIGLWGASTASFGSKLGESAYSLAGIALGLFALFWTWRKGSDSAVPVALVASIFFFVAGGLSDVTTLGNSQVPTTLPAAVARLLVTVTLGLGAGLAVAAVLRLRPTAPVKPAPRRRQSPTPVTG